MDQFSTVLATFSTIVSVALAILGAARHFFRPYAASAHAFIVELPGKTPYHLCIRLDIYNPSSRIRYVTDVSVFHGGTRLMPIPSGTVSHLCSLTESRESCSFDVPLDQLPLSVGSQSVRSAWFLFSDCDSGLIDSIIAQGEKKSAALREYAQSSRYAPGSIPLQDVQQTLNIAVHSPVLIVKRAKCKCLDVPCYSVTQSEFILADSSTRSRTSPSTS